MRTLASLVLLAACTAVTACTGTGEAGPSVESFCTTFAAISRSELANGELPTADDILAAVDAASPLYGELRDRAPEAIAGEAVTVADAFATARSFLERIDYQEARLSEVTAAESAAFDTLSSATSVESTLGRFAAANCEAGTLSPTTAP